MEDPPGSPTVKVEPQEHPDGAQSLNTGEIINLVSDDEDKTTAPANVRTLGSPFEERQQESDAVNLGPSMLSTKPKPAAKPSEKETLKAKREKLHAMVAAKRSETTKKHRTAGQTGQTAQTTQTAQRTPLVGRSELFVTESNPGTPDPAEIFQALQREIAEKRESGTRTRHEEDAFPAA
jgi:hypothetical protein